MTMLHPGMGQVCAFCGRDLWEVRRYVTATVVICDACVETARSVLAATEDDGEREVRFPPRVFGDEPYPGAGEEVASAFAAVIGAGRDPAERAAHLEAADEVAPLIDQAGRQHLHLGARVRVDRVRFVSADDAEVRFTVLLRGGAGFPFDGHAIRRGGRWMVTRETMMAILPPPGSVSPTFASHTALMAINLDESGPAPEDEETTVA